jgi:hypothetical protein
MPSRVGVGDPNDDGGDDDDGDDDGDDDAEVEVEYASDGDDDDGDDDDGDDDDGDDDDGDDDDVEMSDSSSAMVAVPAVVVSVKVQILAAVAVLRWACSRRMREDSADSLS